MTNGPKIANESVWYVDYLSDFESTMYDFESTMYDFALDGPKRASAKGWRDRIVRVGLEVLRLVVAIVLVLSRLVGLLSILVRALLLGIPLLLVLPFILKNLRDSRKKKPSKREDRGPLYD